MLSTNLGVSKLSDYGLTKNVEMYFTICLWTFLLLTIVIFYVVLVMKKCWSYRNWMSMKAITGVD